MVTSAIDASDAGLWRREHSPLGERARQLPPPPTATTTPEAARSPRREPRSEPPGYEVLDFRRQDDEASRYRRARDASAGVGESYSRYAPNSEAARFVVEVRVAVAASSAEATNQASVESEAVSAPGSSSAAEARQARAAAAAAAYEALATSPANTGPSASERTLAAEREFNDYEAARLATLRAQASSAYQAVGRSDDRGRVHVFA